MTDLTRSARPRRGGRRPGWLLLTVLLVLAIGASSALVFTNRVELLKLAVILALWAAVVAAFVSVIYRRQSDIDQAKARDLKLVYDLQLDREISARREYELSVETQLRRELVSELRAQAADEVAGLRAELAALRANLEILFDADLSDRPALESERSTVGSYTDWARNAEKAGRVTSSRIDTEAPDDGDFRTDESPIIDVPEEPHPSEYEWADWRPAPAEGQWIPAGAPGSNWNSTAQPVETYSPAQPVVGNGPSAEYVGKRRAPEPANGGASSADRAADSHSQPAMSPPSSEPRRGRHSAPPEAADPGRPALPPTLAAEPAQPPLHPEPPPAAPTDKPRHRGADDPQTGGQSVADLLARLQATPAGGGRRRRREE